MIGEGTVKKSPLLQTQALSKHFDGITAVDDVDFELPTGQLRALIGPNGAGKSTFVGLLCGRIEASGGTVRFDGVDVTAFEAHQRIALGMAYTFQITSVFTRLSLHENVALAVRKRLSQGHRWRMASHRRLIRSRVLEALDRVGLADRADQMAGDLSYGHQRLLEIAMGLAQAPRLFILDEPTQGLSESEIDAFKQLMHTLKGETTILLIEHNMDVVMQTAEIITVLDMGITLAEGTPGAISANERVQAAYLGTSESSVGGANSA